jgi:superoxide dismutase, Cu-Zn family
MVGLFLRLRGKNHIFGRSVVIHDKPDDLGLGGDKESLITGNAGKKNLFYKWNNSSL